MRDRGVASVVFESGHDFVEGSPQVRSGQTQRKQAARPQPLHSPRPRPNQRAGRGSEPSPKAAALGSPSQPKADRRKPPLDSGSASDVGFFLSTAARFPLLSAERERELAQRLWRSRRRLFRAIEMARRSGGKTPLTVPVGRARHWRRISQETRRRLLAVEQTAEKLLGRIVTGSAHPSRNEGPPPLGSRARRRRSRESHRGRWSCPTVSLPQIHSIAQVLREELETIRAVREELVQHNLRLVIWVAKTYQGRGLDLADLIQEGSMGLLRAIDRFDPAVGTRFSTFATHWVRQGISRALAEKARPIRVPLNRLAELREIYGARSGLAAKLGRPPTATEVSEETGIEPEKVKELLPALSPMESIDVPLSSDTTAHGADLLPDPAGASPLELAIDREQADSIQVVLQRLSARQRLILMMRYGIGYPRPCSLDEIGKTLGLSRERIRQIEKAAREEFKSGWNGRSRLT